MLVLLAGASVFHVGGGSEALARPLPQGVRDSGVRAHVSRGDDLHRRQKPEAAIAAYEEAIALDGSHYEALWKASREATVLGVLAAAKDDREDRYRRGLELARRAVEVDPGDAQGHVRLALAAAHLARIETTIPGIELLRDARRHAARALDLDPSDADAHHAAALWRAEAMKLGRLARVAAKLLPGGSAVQDASWHEAERHLRLAAEGEPRTAAHHLELGRLYLELERPEAARAALRTVLELPIRDPADPHYKEEAQALLRGM